MATWHYAEVTEDGGVGLSFGDFEDAMLDEEDLSQVGGGDVAPFMWTHAWLLVKPNQILMNLS